MESEFRDTSQSDARATIIRCQEDLRNTGPPDAANLLRDTLQAFLGADSDVDRVADRTANSAERDSNGVPVFERESIERVLPEFWNCLDAVNSAIQNLPANLVSELKTLTSDDAWASRLRQAVHAIEQPWIQTRFCRKYPTHSVVEFVQLADRYSIRIRNALVWLCECDAPYEWPEILEAVRKLSPEDAGKRLNSEELKEIVHRYSMFQQVFARYRILDTPETRDGVEIPGVGLRRIGDIFAFNQFSLEAIATFGEESLLQRLFRSGMLLRLPAQAVSLIAIRDAFCGRRTYLPGEAFETDSETASRLKNAGHAVPAEAYPDCRLVRVKAKLTFDDDGRGRIAGEEFDAANLDAKKWEASSKVQILCEASEWVLIRNPNSGNERWWPSDVWATVLAGNLLAIAVDHLQETVQKVKPRLIELGLPRECHLSPEGVRKDWLPYQLIPIREHLPDELNEIWNRCKHFELMVERLPKRFDCGATWQRDCIAAALSILNSITDHTGINPASNVPVFVRAIHQGNPHEGLNRIQKIRSLLEPLRGYSRRLRSEEDEQHSESMDAKSKSIELSNPKSVDSLPVKLIPLDEEILSCLNERHDQWFAIETAIWDRVKAKGYREVDIQASVAALVKANLIETHPDISREWEMIEKAETDEQFSEFDVWPQFIQTVPEGGERNARKFERGQIIPDGWIVVYRLKTYRITMDGIRILLTQNTNTTVPHSRAIEPQQVKATEESPKSTKPGTEVLPHWHRDSRTLTFRENFRKFPPQTGTKVLTILDAFQEFDWRNREDNPLDPDDAKQALRTLNSDPAFAIRFEKDGDQITWVEKSL